MEIDQNQSFKLEPLYHSSAVVQALATRCHYR